MSSLRQERTFIFQKTPRDKQIKRVMMRLISMMTTMWMSQMVNPK